MSKSHWGIALTSQRDISGTTHTMLGNRNAFHSPVRLRYATFLALFTGSVTTALSGCAQWGSQILEDNHVAFNSSVTDAMDRQMLLNIVRLSKDKPVQWMSVSAINVQSTVGAGVNGATTVPSDGAVAGLVGGNVSFSYTPNITFLPRQGDQLAREMMQPISVGNLESMVSAGWPISWVLFLTAEEVQGVSSFYVTRSEGVVLREGKFGRLLQLTDLLQSEQLLSLSLVPVPITWNPVPIPAESVDIDMIMKSKSDRGGFLRRSDGAFDYMSIENAPVLTTYPRISDCPEGREFLELLQLKQDDASYRMLASEDLWPGATFSVRTRSLAAVLRLLSFGVDQRVNAPAPLVDIDTAKELFASMAAITESTTLTPYTNALFRIRCTSAMPMDAATSVRYEGAWYSIANADASSRQVFAMVRDLYDLQVTNDNSAAPVLTLPVGTGR